MSITITPNYDAMFEQFLSDAMLHFARFSEARSKTLTRSEVYSFIASLRIALGCMTKVEQVLKLREEFDAHAEKMFAVLNKEREAEWEKEVDE